MRIKEKIYKKLLQVPSGKITTYGELSRSIGLENGQRIVGQIMKKNPFPVIIPCHRVVKSNGSIGGYAFGVNIKQNMLLNCLLYTSPSPRDATLSRMPSSA